MGRLTWWLSPKWSRVESRGSSPRFGNNSLLTASWDDSKHRQPYSQSQSSAGENSWFVYSKIGDNHRQLHTLILTKHRVEREEDERQSEIEQIYKELTRGFGRRWSHPHPETDTWQRLRLRRPSRLRGDGPGERRANQRGRLAATPAACSGKASETTHRPPRPVLSPDTFHHCSAAFDDYFWGGGWMPLRQIDGRERSARKSTYLD